MLLTNDALVHQSSTNSPMNPGAKPVGNALSVACEVCYVPAGERCHDQQGHKAPAHVVRARLARWMEMLGE